LLLHLEILIQQLFVKLVVIIAPKPFGQPQLFVLQAFYLILSSFLQLKHSIRLQPEL
jgi:hypothetical protein